MLDLMEGTTLRIGIFGGTISITNPQVKFDGCSPRSRSAPALAFVVDEPAIHRLVQTNIKNVKMQISKEYY